MESNSKQITVSVSSDNAEGCAAVASMFAGLARGAAPLTSGVVTGCEQDLRAVPQEAFAATTQPDAPTVDTAAVFAQPAAPAIAGGGLSANTPPVATIPASELPPGALSNVATDKSGLPWDARINTENRAQTQKGIWKRKPGLEDAFYNQVIEQLKATMAAPAPTQAAPVATTPVAATAPTTMAPPPPTATPVVQQPSAPPVPTPPAGGTGTPSAPAGVAAPPAGAVAGEPEPTTYSQLLQSVSQRTMTGKLTLDEVNAVCKQYGLDNITLVSQRPDLIPTIYQGCKAIWDTRG